MTDTARILNRIPYAGFLGLRADASDQGDRVVMPFADHLIGNPMLPALHGGSTAALLEITAIALVAVRYPRPRLPKPINVTVSYLRSGRPRDTHASAQIRRAGRRVLHVTAEAWQDQGADPIATLNAHFLLGQDA
ncbi:MAG: PaaI family thioesterase [Brevundimonas sp.]|uniref:PaaI family thioesterase n=1 Tax=Brevundimonas sp. TaxID=1871086 RepID=UPI0025BC2B47|nr:PaaI family thioesterase [Brevundimonas sp.]MBX3477861.1 PaaI family thioesterase [Brevundimonas sp.]